MSEQPSDGVTFVPYSGIEIALMGVVPVGAVRMRAGCSQVLAAELIAILPGDEMAWRGARTIDDAKARLRAHIARWYDALHTPPAAGQGERLAAALQVPA